MPEPDNIRVATVQDAEAILAIYAPFCAADAVVSFEIAPPSIEEMRDRIGQGLPGFPWLVYVDDQGVVLGYAYASPHKVRAAYRWSVDVSIYLAPQARRRGIGRLLYKELFAILKALGYVNAYAGVTVPNEGSVGLHKAMGFEEVGIYKKVGYKAGKWHDVLWLVASIQEHAVPPAEPQTFAAYLKLRV